jgi:hypothetical protein
MLWLRATIEPQRRLSPCGDVAVAVANCVGYLAYSVKNHGPGRWCS